MKRKINIILGLLIVSILQAFAQTTVNYTYDALNRITKVEYGNGVTVTYTYDALGNRTSKSVTGSVAKTYIVSVSVTPKGSGSVTGGGSYNSGTIVELNAIANAGYEFSKWTDGVTDNPRQLTVTMDQALTAEFIESSILPDLKGDIVIDGKVDNKDLTALVDAYLCGAKSTKITDIDGDGLLTIADVTQMIDIVNYSNGPVNNNGHKYVDLGLPSGVLWATCNIGATTPEEAGEHFAWGETETKTNYSWATYKWCNGDACNLSNQTLTKYCDRGGYGLLDGKITLEPEDDVAHVRWGGDWHTPTAAEFQELMDNCTVKRITLDETTKQRAYQFTGANGKSIILPYAGSWNGENYSSGDCYYWSSDLQMSELPANNHATHARTMVDGRDLTGVYRYRGYAVRPVLSKYTPVAHQIKAPTSHVGHDLVDLGLPSGTLWTTCNLGASSPEEAGCYYAWGELKGSCDGKSNFGIDYYPVDMTDKMEQGENLAPANDIVCVKWGGKWHIPTLSQLSELINKKYTTCEWTTVNGVNGYRITSIIKGFEGNSIFLPATGYYDYNKVWDLGKRGRYWSSTLYGEQDIANPVGYIYFDASNINWWEYEPYYGLPIRPAVSLDDIINE